MSSGCQIARVHQPRWDVNSRTANSPVCGDGFIIAVILNICIIGVSNCPMYLLNTYVSSPFYFAASSGGVHVTRWRLLLYFAKGPWLPRSSTMAVHAYLPEIPFHAIISSRLLVFIVWIPVCVGRAQNTFFRSQSAANYFSSCLRLHLPSYRVTLYIIRVLPHNSCVCRPQWDVNTPRINNIGKFLHIGASDPQDCSKRFTLHSQTDLLN